MKSSFVKGMSNLGVNTEFIPAGYKCILQPCEVGFYSILKHILLDFHITNGGWIGFQMLKMLLLLLQHQEKIQWNGLTLNTV